MHCPTCAAALTYCLYTSDEFKLRYCRQPIGSLQSQLARRDRACQDRAEPLPALAVELHQLKLDAVIHRRSVWSFSIQERGPRRAIT